MKQLSTAILFVLLAGLASAQSVFYEDFENGITSQFTQDHIAGTLDWTNSPLVTLGPAPAVFEGDSSAHFYYGGYSGDISTLTTPSLDLSAGGYRLGFAHVQPNWVGDQNTLSIYISGDDGTTWTLIDSITGDVQNYEEVEYVLDDYMTTTATSMIRFSGWIDYGYSIGLDAVNIFLPENNDAEVTAAVGPLAGCGMSSTETVCIEVYNNGLDSIFSIDGSYQVGSQTETETFSVSIPSGQTDTLCFTTPTDLSVPGTYDFTAWVNLTGDSNAANDSVHYAVESIPVIAALPYMQDFESGAGGWVTGGANSTWQLGDPNAIFIDTAFSGVNAWVTNLTGNYTNSEQSYIESPCMDFSSLVIDPVLRFAQIYNTESCCDQGYVEISVDAGATWTRLGIAGEGENWYNDNLNNEWNADSGPATEWRTATHLLDGAAGQGSVKVRIVLTSDGSITYEGFGVDDINIFEQPPINAGVTEILSPITGCGLGTELVTVIIENFGDADLIGFPIEYQAGSGVVSEVFVDTLFAATVDTFTFAAPLDLTVTGDYAFSAWTAVVGDGDALNDTLSSMITSAPVVTGLPYNTDFESGTGGWYSTGENGIWELGDPEGVLIDTANSGVNAWATNLNSLNYVNDQVSYLISPCFDFSSLLIDPVLNFAFISNSEMNNDGMWLEASTDAGASWTTVGSFGEGTNWYNNENEHGANFDEDWWDGNTADSTQWINGEHLISGVAGSSDVILRFVFNSSGFGSTYEGFAVDDISITEQPPINGALTTIAGPLSGCGLTNAEQIAVVVSNLGSTVMDSIIVSYSLDNQTPVTQVFNQQLLVNSSVLLPLANTIDLSAPADYSLSVWVTTIGDGDTSNDTAMAVVTSVPTITTVPYEEDFESGTGGWTSTGTGGIWELGDPEGMLIDTAFSGVNAWATNLMEPQYVNNQLSFLTSPCIDFSGLTDDPIISFEYISESEIGWDGMWLEVSIDGGTTWSTLGSVGEGENWYNNADEHGVNFNEDWWDGQSGGNISWTMAEHILDSVAGESAVRLRFVFDSDASVNGYEGFAVDDINIHPQPQLDLVAISFDGPDNGCSLDQEQVSFTFWNKGLQTVSGFDVGFTVDGGAAQLETYSGSVAHNDTVSHTFTTELADLSVAATHDISVFTALSGDENMDTDTLNGNSVINHGESTPLAQTEEPGMIISSTIPEGSTSNMFFCGLPASLDGCLSIDHLTIDSIAHTWDSDMVIELISPAGDTILISSGNGGSGDNMVNVTFSDTSSNDITLQTNGFQQGVYHTEDSLGFAQLYDGQNPNGAWQLLIHDLFLGDDGTLVSWSLAFADNSPTPVLDYGDTTICVNQVMDVDLGEVYDSYLWSTGHNTQMIQLFGSTLGLGAYDIYVTVDEGGCTGVSNSFTLTVDACAGIAEVGGLSIDIYPNPSNGEIVLDISGDSKALGLTIDDMNGKVVYAENIQSISSSLRKTIDLKSLAKGMYFLKLANGNSVVTRKLVIQ